MSKKILIYVILLFLTLNVRAQFEVNLIEPVSNQLNLADMFNAILTNETGSEQQVYLEGILKTRKGEVVVSGKSAIFPLGAGVTNINPVNLNLDYIFYKKDIQTGADIPFGDYVICCNLKSKGQTFNNCIEFKVEPLTPPTLIYPENNSVLDDALPNFLWQPPMPMNSNQNVQYSIKLVKLNSNQVCQQAISSNNSIFQETNILSTNLNYPLSALQLDTGLTYCWQIVGRTKEYNIGNSEVWSFKIGDSRNLEKLNRPSIVVLKRDLDAAVYNTQNGKLYFMFEESYISSTLEYKLYDLSANKLLNIDCLNNRIKQIGSNQYEMNFSDCKIPKGVYKLEVQNEKGEDFKVKFNLK